MANRVIAGPAFITASAANVYTPPASTIITKIGHIHLANVTAGIVNVTLYRGATGGSAAGTELLKDYALAAKGSAGSVFDLVFPFGMMMKSTDFLTAIVSTGGATAVTITVFGSDETVP